MLVVFCTNSQYFSLLEKYNIYLSSSNVQLKNSACAALDLALGIFLIIYLI